MYISVYPCIYMPPPLSFLPLPLSVEVRLAQSPVNRGFTSPSAKASMNFSLEAVLVYVWDAGSPRIFRLPLFYAHVPPPSTR